MRHFTDQTTEPTISKFGSSVLYSIRMKMGIIESVLIIAFIKKKLFFSLSAFYFKDLFNFNPFKTVLILPMRAVFINAIIKTRKTLARTVDELFPLFRISRKSSCKFSQLLNSGFLTVYGNIMLKKFFCGLSEI